MHHASVYWRAQSKAGDQPSAAIVNTVTSAGLQGQASQSYYGAAKAGIAAKTKIARHQLASYGVRGNSIVTGVFTSIDDQDRDDLPVKHPD
jgi:NAD(P)-dependent dehydrogenase (short-subunit alcohol dehydrogenase family)